MSELFDANTGLVDVVINSVFPAYRHDDDIRQIALIALWTASENFSADKASFPVYASTYIRNAVIDEIRKNSRKKRLKDACQLTEDIKLEAPDLIQENIDTSAILTAVSQLSQEDQQVIQMLIAGYNQKEIATALDWTDTYINNHNRIQRIRKTIQEKIANLEMSK